MVFDTDSVPEVRLVLRLEVVSGPRTGYPGSRSDFYQVREACAEPNLCSVVVSRFDLFPILNSFSENQNLHQKHLGRVSDPDGVGGYMRKQQSEKTAALKPTKLLMLHRPHGLGSVEVWWARS